MFELSNVHLDFLLMVDLACGLELWTVWSVMEILYNGTFNNETFSVKFFSWEWSHNEVLFIIFLIFLTKLGRMYKLVKGMQIYQNIGIVKLIKIKEWSC